LKVILQNIDQSIKKNQKKQKCIKDPRPEGTKKMNSENGSTPKPPQPSGIKPKKLTITIPQYSGPDPSDHPSCYKKV